jgi:hypothetical protein
MSPMKLLEHILRIVLAGDLSFRFASNPALISFLKISYPNIRPPTRQALASSLMDGATEAKFRLQEYFGTIDAKVSLAIDGWNSRDNRDFLGTSPSVSGEMIFLESGTAPPDTFRYRMYRAIQSATTRNHFARYNLFLTMI